MSNKSYDLIIIGGGPAGITAGIYAARKKLKTLLLTKDFISQVGRTGEIENWPGIPSILGMRLIKNFEEHLRKFEIEILEGQEVTKVDKSYKSDKSYFVRTKSGKEFAAKAVIAATGRVPRSLGIPGEEEFIGKGVSFCSTCDAPFFKGKKVAVVGGGNAGFQAALDLTKYAQRVFIFEVQNRFQADEVLQERAKRESKLQLHLNKQVQKIEGAKNVENITYLDTATKKLFQLPTDGVFVEIGSVPKTDFLRGLVELNEKGEVKVQPKTCETSLAGIFAAGDLNDNPFKQIVTAAADGCSAALAAYDYLQRQPNNENKVT